MSRLALALARALARAGTLHLWAHVPPGETPREHVVNAQQGVRFVRAALDDLRHRPLANPEAWAQAIEGIARDAMAIDNRLALAVAALDRGGR